MHAYQELCQVPKALGHLLLIGYSSHLSSCITIGEQAILKPTRINLKSHACYGDCVEKSEDGGFTEKYYGSC